jgi:hypothetical protein
MHFFRIKIKRHRTPRRPSATNDDEENAPAIPGRSIHEQSPRRLRDSLIQLIPFRHKVSNYYE